MKEQYSNINNEMLYRYVAGISDETESKLVEGSITSDEEVKTRYEKIRRIWELRKSSAVLETFDSEIALSNVKGKIIFQKKGKIKKMVYNLTRIAAVFLLIAGIFWITKSEFFEKTETKMISFVAKGKQNIKLPDNSVVFLNDGATLVYPEKFNDSIRNVEFSGEGYFKITKNPNQPFIISANQTQVRVLGTEFNLKAVPKDPDVIVVVTEGKVRFSDQQNKFVFLQKGDKGRIIKTSSIIEKITNTDKNFMSWKTGVFEFVNTPLPEALNELGSFYNVSFKIKRSSLKDFQISARYDSVPVNDLIEILKLTLNSSIEKTGSVYILK